MAAAPGPGAGDTAGSLLSPMAGCQEACERCGAAFYCGVAGPAPCACTGLQLTPAHHAAMRLHYQRCLCISCLAAIAGGAPVVPAPTP